MKLKSTNCKWCGKNYEIGFYGAGPVYCSHECSKIGRSKRTTTGNYYVQKDKPCIVCKRSILVVGLRKSVNKYCSKRCKDRENVKVFRMRRKEEQEFGRVGF